MSKVKLRMYEEGSHTAVLEDSEGTEFEINIIAEMDHDNHTYCAYFESGHGDVGAADIMELFLDTKGQKVFMTIEDEKLYQEIAEMFVKIYEEALPDPKTAN